MTEHDDTLSRRYRELARDEPPPALDAAILSASKRAVAARPRRRWATLVSIAAVLVLGFGISLRMQMEEPGIETSTTPAEGYVPPPAPNVEQAPAAKRERAPEAKVERKRALQKSAPAKQLEARPFADAVTPSAPPAGSVASDVPAAAMRSAEPVPAAPAPSPLAAPVAPRADPARGLREQSSSPQSLSTLGIRGAGTSTQPTDAVESRAKAKADEGERDLELERIARLRMEGRHIEADRALDEFRRKHPDYRIPEAMWERVRAR